MGKKADVFVDGRSKQVSLDICFEDSSTAGELIIAFGDQFSQRDSHSGYNALRQSRYYGQPSTWHVVLCVDEKQKTELDSFLKEFCEERALNFEDRK